MSLLDRLREAQEEPARHRASPYVGPSILTVAQLRAMERALAHEGFFDGETTPVPEVVVEAPHVIEGPLPTWTPPEAVTVPVIAAQPPAQALPAQALPAQALPLWSPPVFEPSLAVAPVAVALLDPCPKCGEEVEIERIDLTANAGWLSCRACGLRWGGTIDPSPADRRPVLRALLPADHDAGERGHIAAG